LEPQVIRNCWRKSELLAGLNAEVRAETRAIAEENNRQAISSLRDLIDALDRIEMPMAPEDFVLLPEEDEQGEEPTIEDMVANIAGKDAEERGEPDEMEVEEEPPPPPPTLEEFTTMVAGVVRFFEAHDDVAPPATLRGMLRVQERLVKDRVAMILAKKRKQSDIRGYFNAL
jgi:hypothetical protein